MIAIETIQARRDQLASQADEAERRYNELEQLIKTIDRQLCMMRGGVAELDALLAHDAARELGAHVGGEENGHEL